MYSVRKNKEKWIFLWLFARLFVPLRPKMKQTAKRHIASWMLLAVFLPMLMLSSLHFHEVTQTIETECADCVHHSCHGHMTATSAWSHDCVLCQFVTLTMLTAAVMAVTLYVHVCKKSQAQPLCGYCAVSCGTIVTRGPPTV